MWNLFKKLNRLLDVLVYFMNNEWIVIDTNVQTMWKYMSERDQQMFAFNMKEFDWICYFSHMYAGVRLYLFKEDDSVLEKAYIKKKR